jgi:hypothetical protein
VNSFSNKPKRKIFPNAPFFEDFEFKDRERSALWEKRDWKKVSLVYQKLREYNKFCDQLNEMILMAKKGETNAMYKKFRMSSDEKNHVINLLQKYKQHFFTLLFWWENNLERVYTDQTAHWFDTKEKFEPVQCQIISNRLTGRGLALSAQYMTGQSAAYPKWIAVGTGVRKVFADDQTLGAEVSRAPADYYAANGNIISSGVLFSENVVDTLPLSEFGGMTGPDSSDSMVWRSVIEDAAKRLYHDQGVTRPTTSHSLYLTSR